MSKFSVMSVGALLVMLAACVNNPSLAPQSLPPAMSREATPMAITGATDAQDGNVAPVASPVNTLPPTAIPTSTPTPTPTLTATPTTTPTATLTPKTPTAEDILFRAAETMEALSSLSVTMTISIQMPDVGVQMDMEATGYGAGEQAFLQLTMLGETIEMFVADKDEIYMRMTGDPNWERIPIDPVATPGSNPADVFGQWPLLFVAENIRLLEDEEIAGVFCHRLAYDFNLERYWEVMGGEDESVGLTDVSGEAWVGQGDFIIYQQTMMMNYLTEGVKAGAHTLVQVHSFNEPVAFPSVD